MGALYYAAFIPEENGVYAVFFPDIAGASTQGETLEECLSMGAEVLAIMVEDLVAARKPLPKPSTLAEAKEKIAAELRELEVEPAGEILYQLFQAPSVDMTPVKISISLPKAELEAIDAKAKGLGMTRSGLLVSAARVYHGPSL